ncbi:hypothetical protein J2847_002961 [Azospirillum agricola]|uniref:hypothetical protein n=1 Tax=Azospirillum agricola TaxID=1720247 RepID=UPI001AE57629|nr:hypothetical protein [Azospirillum agricola]MBP2229662.1 hypothetical protein [Azospirillum agricola]
MATIDSFDAIRSFVDAGWGDAAPVSCPLAWDNEPFTEPQPRGPAAGPDGKLIPNHWARVIISGDLWEQASIGTGEPAEERWDESGEITVIAFASVNTGSRTLRSILTAFAELCRGQDAGGIEFQDIRFDPIGAKDESGNWWGMHITINWLRRG